MKKNFLKNNQNTHARFALAFSDGRISTPELGSFWRVPLAVLPGISYAELTTTTVVLPHWGNAGSGD